MENSIQLTQNVLSIKKHKNRSKKKVNQKQKTIERKHGKGKRKETKKAQKKNNTSKNNKNNEPTKIMSTTVNSAQQSSRTHQPRNIERVKAPKPTRAAGGKTGLPKFLASKQKKKSPIVDSSDLLKITACGLISPKTAAAYLSELEDPVLDQRITLKTPLDSVTLNTLTREVAAIPSETFFRLNVSRTLNWNDVKDTLSELTDSVPVAWFAMWVQNHWVAVELSRTSLIIFDSARSDFVHNEIRRSTRRLELPQPVFPMVPQQFFNSDECGLFAAMYIHARVAGIEIPHCTRQLSLKTTLGESTPRKFIETSLKLLTKVAEAPVAGASPLSRVDIRNILQQTDVGARVEHTFRIAGDSSNKVHRWFGTVIEHTKGASSRPASMKWKIRFDHYDEVDDEDIDEYEFLPDSVSTFPMADDSVVTLGIRVLHSRSAESVSSPDGTIRDYSNPSSEFHPLEPGAWPRLDHQRSCPDRINGDDFLDLGLLSFSEVQRKAGRLLAWGALTQGVRRTHVNELLKLSEFVKKQPDRSVHMQVLIDMYVQKRRVDGDLAWSTVSRLVGTLIGAFASLDYYSTYGYHISLLKWPAIRDLLIHANRLLAKVGSREPVAATPRKVRRAIEKLNEQGHFAEAAALALCWYTAQRPCDVLLLRLGGVKVLDDDKFVIRFREGKVIGRIQAYHIHFRITNDDANTTVHKLLQDRQGHESLFEFSNGYRRTKFLTTIRTALREVDPDLELRSLRRGTLQMYAKAGVPEAALITYSRHTTIAALQNYFGWEAIETEHHRSMMNNAECLGGSVHTLSTSSTDGDPCLRVTDDGVQWSHERTPPDPTHPVNGASDYNLLAKEQTRNPISVSAFNDMALQCSSEVRAFLAEASKFTQDPTMFDGVDCKITEPTAKLRHTLVQQSVDIGHAVLVPDADVGKIRGHVRFLGVDEHDKVPPRTRGLQHSPELNDAFNNYPWKHRLKNSTRRSQREAYLPQEGRLLGSISLDCCGWFQQIPISDDVSWFFCFRSNGFWYRYLRLTTGSTWSTDVATAHTLVLTDGTPSSVIVDTATDNMRFVGEFEETVDAAYRVVLRCRAVGAELNDIDVFSATRDQVAALWKTRDADWFGEVGDHDQRLIASRPKHVVKLNNFLRVSQLPRASHRTLFGLRVMCEYMSETQGVPLKNFGATLRWFARRSRELALKPALWDAPPTLRPPLVELKKWVLILSKNVPGRIVEAPPILTVIHMDACRFAYAAIIDCLTSDPFLLQVPWSDDDIANLNLRRSTNSEPEAAARISEELTRRGIPGRYLFVTDHDQFALATQRGHSLSESNNDRLQRLAPWTEMVYEPGQMSLADPYSRLKRVRLTPEDSAAARRRSLAYVSACTRGVRTYGIVGEGSDVPARLFRSLSAHNVDSTARVEEF